MKPAFLLLLAATASLSRVAEECTPLDPANPVFAEVAERMGTLGGRPPDGITRCAGHVLYWYGKWDLLESGEGWTRTGSGRCAGRYEDGQPQIRSCSRWYLVEGEAFNGRIRLQHDIHIDRIQELAAAAYQVIPAEDRIRTIGYTPVRDGSAWSAERHGYQVQTSRHPHHGSGVVLHILAVCGPDACGYKVVITHNWAS